LTSANPVRSAISASAINSVLSSFSIHLIIICLKEEMMTEGDRGYALRVYVCHRKKAYIQPNFRFLVTDDGRDGHSDYLFYISVSNLSAAVNSLKARQGKT
jgi:hypothetical protein